MLPKADLQDGRATISQFSAADVAAILREQNWLQLATPPECESWLASAATLLGPQAPDRAALADLLRLIFHYDARAILQSEDCHSMLARAGARDVIRSLAHFVLDGPAVDSDRFKEIVTSLKNALHVRGRELFYPIRISLAGRAGEGELDRVILLLDSAAALPFSVVVKGTRQRMLEFCAGLD
jgi:hypothetical protein